MNYQTPIDIHIISSHFILVLKAYVTGDVKENEFGTDFGRYQFVATHQENFSVTCFFIASISISIGRRLISVEGDIDAVQRRRSCVWTRSRPC
jgi:hypothetical protein